MKTISTVRITYLIFCFFITADLYAQPVNAADSFWMSLRQHCGNSYAGIITAGGREGDGFTGKKLLMQVKSCETGRIRIPFYVGDDRSRTWVLTKAGQNIQLKHDHRHEDGSEDKVTQYGGLTTNTGSGSMQVFPADQATCELLPYACGNIWWITNDGKTFTYNLRRIGSDRLFIVSFDLSKPISSDLSPWGWKE